jgi:hypothetical protein
VITSLAVLRRIAAIGLALGAGSRAHANPAGIVPGGLDSPMPNVAQSRVDAIIGVDYEYEQDSSTIWREDESNPNLDPNAPLPQHRDLAFKQFRHTLTPNLAVGIYHDTFFTAALPIVIAQARELRLDQGVDRLGSTTVADGLLPAAGYDAQDPTAAPPGDLMFRGVTRHGINQVVLGLGVAPMNQARDDTKPTWKLGADIKLAVGSVMKFDPTAPGANTAVGTGVHELRLWTSFDRRLGWAEPWMEIFWQVPLTATQSSLFQNPGFGTTNYQLSQTAGVSFGFEAYAIDNATDHNRISLDVGTKVVAHFEGRDYSEMWEVFASAGDSRGTGPLILDADPTKMGTQAMSYPGISNIENYLETAAKIRIRAEIGPHVRFAVGADIVWKTDHVITFADAGVDLPTCTGGQTTGCETNANDLVNPGTEEVNPLHVGKIDLVGHRYHSEDNFGVVIGVSGEVLF